MAVLSNSLVINWQTIVGLRAGDYQGLWFDLPCAFQEGPVFFEVGFTSHGNGWIARPNSVSKTQMCITTDYWASNVNPQTIVYALSIGR